MDEFEATQLNHFARVMIDTAAETTSEDDSAAIARFVALNMGYLARAIADDLERALRTVTPNAVS